MLKKPLLFAYGFLFLLLPSLAWSLNEPADTPPTPAEAVLPAPANPIPEQTAPAKPAPQLQRPVAPAPLSSVQAAPTQLKNLVPAPAFSASSAPAAAAPLKSGTLPAAPAKPGAVPVSPAKPSPVPIAPAKPAPVPVSPVMPAPIAPAKPAPAPSVKSSLSANSAPVQSAPIQSIPAQIPAITAEKETSSDLTTGTVDIEVFVREDCPHCEKAKEFIAKLHSLKPHLKIIFRDVRKEPAALELLKRMAQNQAGNPIDYPAFVVGGQLIIGFTEEASTAQLILDTLAASHPRVQNSGNNNEDCDTGKELSCNLIPPAPEVKQENIILNMFGLSVPLLQIGLPLFTLAMGMLDGLNHGSTWVLILMISLLSPLKNRPLMSSIAGTFLAVQGLVYFILLAVWLNIVTLIDVSRITEISFVSIALLAGVIYFIKYIQFGHHIPISAHEITKPGIYSRIRKIVQTESLGATLLATTVLAIMVQAGEFSYTSVFPALYTHVLALQNLHTLSNYGYLLLYDFAYMLDDIIILSIGVATLSLNRPKEKTERMLKLISALALLALATYLLLTLR